jgi:hydroxyacylglutathione hydrolase
MRCWGSILVAMLAAGCFTSCVAPRPEKAISASALFAQPWNAGLSAQEPAFQAQPIDGNTIVIRQSIRTTFEAPFLYLLFGQEKALLIDTGAEGGNPSAEIDRLIGDWLAANGRKEIALVVMHSHGHSDHVSADAGFAGRANTTVVGHSADDVASFFEIRSWPEGSASFDLGGRMVDILPTPGHHPSHVMVFDRATGILFSGDAVYPGRLYFQCGKASEYLASIDRLIDFSATRNVRWLLGGHIEMTTAPGQAFSPNAARPNERALELPPSILPKIRNALADIADRPRVTPHDEFVLFPHPADPRGKQPPDWCL